MSRILAAIFCVLVFLICIQPSDAANSQSDSIRRSDLRILSNEKLDALRTNPDFNYGMGQNKVDSVWEKVKGYFFELIKKFFSNRGVAPYIRYFLVLVVLTLVILELSGRRIDSFFLGKGKRIAGEVIHSDEKLREADLNDLAEKAAAQGDLRLAIRYYYLQLLRLLNDEGLIQWHKEKTNRDYLREINDPKIRTQFLYQTLVFDHVWYGKFEITTNHFQEIKNGFTMLSGIINSQKTKPEHEG